MDLWSSATDKILYTKSELTVVTHPSVKQSQQQFEETECLCTPISCSIKIQLTFQKLTFCWFAWMFQTVQAVEAPLARTHIVHLLNFFSVTISLHHS